MKRILSVLTLGFALTLAAHAQSEVGYFTGSWWNTKAPKLSQRTAGQIDVYLFDDNSVQADIWYNGQIVNTGYGTWNYTTILENKVRITFTFTNPSIYTWSVIVRTSLFDDGWFGSGTFKSSPNGTFAGRWQVTTLN